MDTRAVPPPRPRRLRRMVATLGAQHPGADTELANRLDVTGSTPTGAPGNRRGGSARSGRASESAR